MLKRTRMVMAALALLSGSVVAAEDAGTRLDAMEKRLDTQQDTIQEQSALIRQQADMLMEQAKMLQEFKADPPVTQSTQDEIRAMVRKYLDVAAEKEAGKAGVVSMADEWLKIGGMLQVNYVWVEQDPHYYYATDEFGSVYGATFDVNTPPKTFFGAVVPSASQSEIQLDEVDLIFDAYYTDDVYVHLCIESDWSGDFYPFQAYLHYGDILKTFGINDPVNLWLQAGRFEPLDIYARETTTRGLLEGTFFRNSTPQIAIGADYDVLDNVNIYSWLALMNGQPLVATTAHNTSVARYPLIIDGFANRDFNNNKRVGVGLGTKIDLGQYGELDALTYWYWGRLSEADQAFLSGIWAYQEEAGYNFPGAAIVPGFVPRPVLTSDRYERAGAVFNYNVDIPTIGNLRMNIAFADVTMGEWDRRAYEFFFRQKIDLPGWEHAGRKWWTWVAPFYRFSAMDEKNIIKDAYNSLTWDRQKHDLGFAVGVTENVQLRFEWSLFDEEIGNLYPIVATGGARPSPVDGADDPDDDQFQLVLEANF